MASSRINPSRTVIKSPIKARLGRERRVYPSMGAPDEPDHGLCVRVRPVDGRSSRLGTRISPTVRCARTRQIRTSRAPSKRRPSLPGCGQPIRYPQPVDKAVDN